MEQQTQKNLLDDASTSTQTNAQSIGRKRSIENETQDGRKETTEHIEPRRQSIDVCDYPQEHEEYWQRLHLTKA